MKGVRYVCVEMQSEAATLLKRNTRGLPVNVYESPLSSDSGQVVSYAAGRSNVGGTHMLGLTDRNTHVSTMTLGDLSIHTNRVVAKLDIEGSEPLLFEGESNRAFWTGPNAPVAVVVEVWEGKNGQINDLLREVGYSEVKRSKNMITYTQRVLFHEKPFLTQNSNPSMKNGFD